MDVLRIVNFTIFSIIGGVFVKEVINRLIDRFVGYLKTISSRHEERWGYSSTAINITNDFSKIVNLTSSNMKLKDNIDQVWHNIKSVSFYLSESGVEKLIKNTSLEKEMSCSLSLCNINKSHWRLSQMGYNIIFGKDSFSEYVDEKIKPLIQLLQAEGTNLHYQYTLIQYEDVIHTVANTLEESLELTDDIPEELQNYTIKLVDRFGKAISEKQNDIKATEELDRKAIKDSLAERLKYELDYTDLLD